MSISNTLTQLDTYGYAIVPNVVSEQNCSLLGDSLDRLESDLRPKNLVTDIGDRQTVIYCIDLHRPDLFLSYIDFAPITDVIAPILGDPFILSSFAASRSGKGGGWRPHIDGRIPTTKLLESTHVSAVICLDDFNEQNGAIEFWTYSHKTGQKPPADVTPDKLDGRVITNAKKGSIVFFLGSTWHEVGKNFSGNRRWGVIITYCRWWTKPTYNYTACGEDIYKRLTSNQKKIYGFTSIPPNPMSGRNLTLTNVEELPENYIEVFKR